MLTHPVLLEGGCHVDARGSISFVNGFTFDGVERFYRIQSPQVGMQRGWVGHLREHKWFTVVAGEVQVAVVKPDDWHSPSVALPVVRYLLSAMRLSPGGGAGRNTRGRVCSPMRFPQPFHPS